LGPRASPKLRLQGRFAAGREVTTPVADMSAADIKKAIAAMA